MKSELVRERQKSRGHVTACEAAAEFEPRTLGLSVSPRRVKVMPKDEPEAPYVGLEHIEPQTMKLLGTVPAGTMKSAGNRFYAGDVLYSRLRPYLNKVWLADRDGICSGEFIVIPPPEDIEPAWLAYRLHSQDFVQFANGLNAGDRPRVDFDQLSSFPFLLPSSLATQRKVVARLDEQFSRLDQAVASLRRAQANLKRYRASVLKAACEGRLVPTEAELARQEGRSYESGPQLLERILEERRTSWNGKGKYKEPAAADTANLPELPEGWTWARLEQLATVVGGLTKNPKREAIPTKLPYLRVANVYANELRLTDIECIGVSEGELEKLLVKRGDLLIVEGNGSQDQIGRLAIWDGSIDPCVHQNHLIKVRPVPSVDGKYCLYWLLSPGGRQIIERVSSSTSGLHTLSTGKIGDLFIPLPPPAEQQRIVSEIEQRLSVTESLEATVAASLGRSARVRQSTLQGTFNGDGAHADEPEH